MTNELKKAKGVLPTAKSPKPAKLGLEWGDDGVLQINAHGDFDRLFKVPENAPFVGQLIGQIASLGSQGKRMDEGASNFALGFVESMKPRDVAETLLITQMAAIHQATMMLARRLNHTDNIPQQDSAERALNKLARTFAAQMDTLKRYRSKGQQVVRVERVTVQDGGQAIVGNVETKGRGNNES